MSIVVYQDVATPIIPAGDLAGPVRDALGASLRSMRYVSPDFTGLYQDSAGTVPVTAVGQPVGLMLDRRFGLERGPELVTNGDFSNGATGWTINGANLVISGGKATWTAAGANERITQGVLDPTKTYEASYEVSGYVNGSVYPAGGSTSIGNGNGVWRTIITGASSVYIRSGGSGFSGSVDNISIREIPGNHASQATTTARPTLRSGPLRIDYDGVDDYLRTVFPALGSSVTIARSIPGVGAQYLTGQTIAAGNWDDNVDSCATLVIDRALTGPETALVTAFLNQQAGV